MGELDLKGYASVQGVAEVVGDVSVVSTGGMSERGQGARRVSAYREYW
jgi:hypothetical protein